MRGLVGTRPLPSKEPKATDVEETALIASAKLDRAAFGLLYDRYLDDVYGYCYRQLGGREAAEDATQLIFTKAFAGIGRYDHRSFRGWLFTIAHNVVVDAQRARRPYQEIDAAAEIEDPAPSPEELAVAGDESRRIRALLVRLSPQQRAVVELRLGALTDREIAAVLRMDYGAVRQTQHRALLRLRELMGIGTTREEGRDDRA
jgi:RNA polymerase sigma-70 factor (ECF subfamily)